MTSENPNIPDWARREHETDLEWIDQNLELFWMASELAFEDDARGALVVDTTLQFTPDSGHPIGYYAQEQVDEFPSEDLKRMVNEYEPASEFVLVLLKSGDRASIIGCTPPSSLQALLARINKSHFYF